ncbi:CAP domain-containing protein [Enterococcus hermanniensis]|uniref:Uncharacterized protein n=1 Tax=Enterococcus hermanniensis TaxID=249189 RepID=A0A1L8TJW2_9ENTE|nr:hypothetical protein [Enterococcus hermanniensis]OJG44374.1 hypothetical protein RV04_GL000568 [Enterococcus hermanniensis]
MEDFILKKYVIKSNKNKLNEFDTLKISSSDLKLVELMISEKLFMLINDYRKKIHITPCVGNNILQKSADIRAQELQERLNHTRPNGEEGSQLAYNYGYSRQNKIEGEAIGQLASSSLVYLINKGAKTAFDMLINSSPKFLVGSQTNQQATGICIKKGDREFSMTFEYVCSQDLLDYGSSSFLRDKTQLVRFYNLACELVEADYERHSWGQLMLMMSKAKQIYDDVQVSKIEIDQTIEEFIATLSTMKKTN